MVIYTHESCQRLAISHNSPEPPTSFSLLKTHIQPLLPEFRQCISTPPLPSPPLQESTGRAGALINHLILCDEHTGLCIGAMFAPGLGEKRPSILLSFPNTFPLPPLPPHAADIPGQMTMITHNLREVYIDQIAYEVCDFNLSLILCALNLIFCRYMRWCALYAAMQENRSNRIVFSQKEHRVQLSMVKIEQQSTFIKHSIFGSHSSFHFQQFLPSLFPQAILNGPISIHLGLSSPIQLVVLFPLHYLFILASSSF